MVILAGGRQICLLRQKPKQGKLDETHRTKYNITYMANIRLEEPRKPKTKT